MEESPLFYKHKIITFSSIIIPKILLFVTFNDNQTYSSSLNKQSFNYLTSSNTCRP